MNTANKWIVPDADVLSSIPTGTKVKSYIGREGYVERSRQVLQGAQAGELAYLIMFRNDEDDEPCFVWHRRTDFNVVQEA